MAKPEGSASAISANHKRGLRPLALFAALVLAGCSAGNNTDKSAEAKRDVFIGKSGAPAPEVEGSKEIPILVDCKRNPRAMGGVAAVQDPAGSGEAYVLGTYDSTVSVKPGDQRAVLDGVRVSYVGSHRYSVTPANEPGANPLEVLDFSGDNSQRVAMFALNGASVSVESVSMPDNNTIVALVATIVCGQTVRS